MVCGNSYGFICFVSTKLFKTCPALLQTALIPRLKKGQRYWVLRVKDCRNNQPPDAFKTLLLCFAFAARNRRRLHLIAFPVLILQKLDKNFQELHHLLPVANGFFVGLLCYPDEKTAFSSFSCMRCNTCVGTKAHFAADLRYGRRIVLAFWPRCHPDCGHGSRHR